MRILPDIPSSEKSIIRELARIYAQSLWTIPFNKGFIAYVKTSNEIFVHPARWRYCFKCGMILKANLSKEENVEDDETIHHSCILEEENLPLLIKTSWIKLRNFFLLDKSHNIILKEIGLSKLPEQKLIKKTSEQEEVLDGVKTEKLSSETV